MEDEGNLLQQIREREALDRYRLLLYAPYAKQAEFHGQGTSKRERLFAAGNRCGKSEAGGMEAAFHATGLYPEWWTGRRFGKPTRGWVAGISNEATRDIAQAKLYGPLEAPGTGAIPSHLIRDVSWSRGIQNFMDTLLVTHITGGISYISFKSYEQGRLKFQGAGLDWIWCDEEPPQDIYAECLARIVERKGIIYTTFTPLLGMTDVVRHFFPRPDTEDRGLVRMELDEALHIDAAERERAIRGYPLHEVEARTKGMPILGSGRVFPIAESLLQIDPFPIPDWWPRISGIDFGWDHPTAAVWLALHPETKAIFVTDCYRQSRESPVVHSAAIRARGAWIPVAWPKDGYDERSGMAVARQYFEQGLRMLPEHAQFPDGGIGVEAGIMGMLDLMKTGRFKVFSNCFEWWEEFRSYHRKEGKIVKEGDDLMAATRYAFMSTRFAREKQDEVRAMPITVGMDYDPLH